MKCKIKVVNDEFFVEHDLPNYQSSAAAGIDLVAAIAEPITIKPQDQAVLIPTGIAVQAESDAGEMCGMIFPRSGLGHKQGLVLGNGTGIIDSDYQGEVFVSAWNRNASLKEAGVKNGSVLVGKNNRDIVVNPGDRIAQLVFVPVLRMEFEQVDSFEVATSRGEGGFGSTGKKSARKTDK